MEQQARYAVEHRHARPDAERVSRPAPAAAFADNRPGTVTLRKLAAAMDASSRVAAQRKLSDTLNSGQRMTAQWKLADVLDNRPRVEGQPKSNGAGSAGPVAAMRGTVSSAQPIQLLWNRATFRANIDVVAPKSRWDFFFEKAVYSENPEFKTIISLLGTYEDIDNEGANDKKARQDKTALLHELEEEAYDWYAGHKAGDDGTREHKNRYHDVIIDLLNDIRNERRDLVQEIVRNRDDVWVPGLDAMTVGDKTNVQNLWRNLLGNRGRLKVRKGTSAADKAKVYADYLQLISGPHGRNLLSRALAGNVANQNNVITIDPNAVGEPAAEPYSDVASHRRLPFGDARYAQSIDPTQQITLTKNEMQQTVRGAGSGSKIPFRDAPAFGNYYALGKDAAGDTPYELMPSFLVLGHELGHAIRQQHGESTVRIQSPFHNTPAGHSWHNTEEHAVITGTENKLRKEHNLGEREFHRAVPIGGNAAIQ